MVDRRGRAFATIMLVTVVTGCGGDVADQLEASRVSGTLPASPDAEVSTFPETDEPIAVEAGTYRIPRSAWSVADFTVSFPEDWTVQYGHVYAKHPDTDEEFGFYAVVVDAIYADACDGEAGELAEVGTSVDDLSSALLQQEGPKVSGLVETTLGGYPAIRIDLTVPKGLDLKECLLADFGVLGLQVWYSPPADKYFVLLRDHIASVYIVDVDGERQVFLTAHTPATSDEDVRELEAVLDSIRIET